MTNNLFYEGNTVTQQLTKTFFYKRNTMTHRMPKRRRILLMRVHIHTANDENNNNNKEDF